MGVNPQYFMSHTRDFNNKFDVRFGTKITNLGIIYRYTNTIFSYINTIFTITFKGIATNLGSTYRDITTTFRYHIWVSYLGTQILYLVSIFGCINGIFDMIYGSHI